MKTFSVEREAQLEFDAAAAWYEREREGLGFEFIEEGREFVRRFPYVVIFVETSGARRVIMIRRGNVSSARWRSRI